MENNYSNKKITIKNIKSNGITDPKTSSYLNMNKNDENKLNEITGFTANVIADDIDKFKNLDEIISYHSIIHKHNSNEYLVTGNIKVKDIIKVNSYEFVKNIKISFKTLSHCKN